MSGDPCRNQGESKGKLGMEIFEQKENSCKVKGQKCAFLSVVTLLCCFLEGEGDHQPFQFLTGGFLSRVSWWRLQGLCS